MFTSRQVRFPTPHSPITIRSQVFIFEKKHKIFEDVNMSERVTRYTRKYSLMKIPCLALSLFAVMHAYTHMEALTKIYMHIIIRDILLFPTKVYEQI